MRPRINQREAEFILYALVERKKDVEALLEHRDALAAEVSALKKTWTLDPFEALKAGYKSKSLELRELENLTMLIHHTVAVFDSLVEKYTALATGSKRCGRHKHSATDYMWRLPLLR